MLIGRRARLGTAAIFLAAACSGDSGPAVTASLTPATMAIVGGNSQSADRSTALAQPLRVKIADAAGAGVAGKSVAFVVESGGGSLSASSAVTGSDGIAQVSWTLGAQIGSQSVRASYPSLPSVDFAATATSPAGVPATITVTAGSNQVAMAGTAVAVAPSVVVRDGKGQPVAGVAVTFSVSSGGGSVTGGTINTDAAGQATVGTWTLGAVAQPNTLTITAAGLTGSPAGATGVGCATSGSSGYSIVVCFVTPVNAAQRAAFEQAAARWGTVITGKLPDVNANVPAGNCGTNSPAINIHIDDLLVLASVEAIDGQGSTIAGSSVCSVRTNLQLPVTGRTRLDEADAAAFEANGHLNATVLHEMGHLLGIGSLWPNFNLLQNPTQPTGPAVDTYYSGANGLIGFNAIGGASYTAGQKVPVENTQSRGAGSYNTHWRESVFTTELMTPSANIGVPTPLSEMTVRALADLGYVVNPAAADAFSIVVAANGLAARARVGQTGTIDLSGDVDFTQPLYAIDPAGRMTRIR